MLCLFLGVRLKLEVTYDDFHQNNIYILTELVTKTIYFYPLLILIEALSMFSIIIYSKLL